ncbi:hypothetical protein C0J52_26482 [Blattella germanica]|nr:hypothetical protein C0J52_28169 [Blattella germanica]PSN30156.1 hypothetical protein C0J52_26482 [Blattella germanica]
MIINEICILSIHVNLTPCTECSIINGTSCFSANLSKAVPDACTYPKLTNTVDLGLSEGLEHCY